MFCLLQAALSTTLQWIDNKQKNKERREAKRQQSCQLNSDELRKTEQSGSERHRRTVSCVCHGLTKLYQTHARTHHSNTEGFQNMNSLYLSQGHVPEAHSQSDCRLNASGAVQAVEIKLSVIFQQMKKKPEIRARIRCKKEDTCTSNKQFYLCAERKTGAGFTQTDLQRKRSKTIPSSEAGNEHVQSHTTTVWSVLSLRSICGTMRSSRHWSLLS